MKIKAFSSNMTEVELSNGVLIIVSYQTAVACHIPGRGFFKTEKHWSRTTTAHVNKWIKYHGGNPENAGIQPQTYFDSLI